MTEWLVRHSGGGPIGPVSTTLLYRGLELGKVPADAQIRPASGGEWLPVEAYAEFAEAVQWTAQTKVVDSPWFVEQQKSDASASPSQASPPATAPEREASQDFDDEDELTRVAPMPDSHSGPPAASFGSKRGPSSAPPGSPRAAGAMASPIVPRPVRSVPASERAAAPPPLPQRSALPQASISRPPSLPPVPHRVEPRAVSSRPGPLSASRAPPVSAPISSQPISSEPLVPADFDDDEQTRVVPSGEPTAQAAPAPEPAASGAARPFDARRAPTMRLDPLRPSAMAYMSAHPTPAQRAPAASPGNEAAVVLRDVLEPTLPAQQMYARSRPPPPEPLTLDATMKLLIVLIVVLAVALAVVLVLLARR